MTGVLVIDDDPSIAVLISDVLQSAGYGVRTAFSGEEALDFLVRAERAPSLILLDLIMPGMDGWHFREIQRNHTKLAHIPVLVMSDAPVSERYASSLGAVGIMVKPFGRKELLAAVTRAVFDRRGGLFAKPV
jgi:CheY-like chemotaxis protein